MHYDKPTYYLSNIYISFLHPDFSPSIKAVFLPYLYIYLAIYLFVYKFIYISFFVSMHLLIYLFVYPFTYLSFYQYIFSNLYIHLSIFLFIYQNEKVIVLSWLYRLTPANKQVKLVITTSASTMPATLLSLQAASIITTLRVLLDFTFCVFACMYVMFVYTCTS